MFGHTSGGSAAKHCFFWFFWLFSKVFCFFLVFIGFLLYCLRLHGQNAVQSALFQSCIAKVLYCRRFSNPALPECCTVGAFPSLHCQSAVLSALPQSCGAKMLYCLRFSNPALPECCTTMFQHTSLGSPNHWKTNGFLSKVQTVQQKTNENQKKTINH